MSTLPGTGVVRYGTFTFPSDSETTALSVVPRYDAAGRTVIYNIIRISLRAILTGSAIDAAVRAATQVLTRPALPFVYTGRGYVLSVNVSQERDAVWGPKPSEVSVRPLGGGNAVEINWTVEVHVPDGPGAKYRFAAMEAGFTVAYDVDDAGYTVRRYDAYLAIPQTRQTPNDRTLTDTADRYREAIYPPLLPGFRRTPGADRISADKCRVDMSCVDTQLPPNLPPPGCIHAEASHTLDTVPGRLDKMWTGRLSATYEIARNGRATYADAIRAFFALMKDRLDFTRQRLEQVQPQLSAGGNNRLPAFVMPVGFSMGEPELYGRTKVRLGMTYTVTCSGLSSMLQASGLWRPHGPTWGQWVAEVGPILGPRGHAGLVLSVNDDRIVDLFGQYAPGSLLAAATQAGGRAGRALLGKVFAEPTPENSFIVYECAVHIEFDSGVVQVQSLPTELRTPAGDYFGGGAGAAGIGTGSAAAGAAGTGVAAALGNLAGLFPAVFPGGQPSSFFFPPPRTAAQQKAGGGSQRQPPQRRARQTGAIFLVGRALRARFAIPAPSLSTWNGVNLVPANRPDRGEGFWTAVVGNALWPVTAARWRLRYLPDGPLPSETAPAVPNPLLGGGGQAAATLPADLGDFLGGVKLPEFPFG